MVLSAIIFVSASLSIFAASLDRSNLGTIKVGYIDDASGLSETLTDDDIITDYDLSYNLSAEGLQIAGTIKGEAFSVNATVETTNYHGNALIYFGEDSCGNYDVLSINIEGSFDDAVFFFVDDVKDSYSNIIKLYMKPNDDNGFIIVEIFIENDFVSYYLLSNEVKYDSSKSWSSLMWFTEYVESYESSETYDSRAVKDYIEFNRKYDLSNRIFKVYLKVNVICSFNNSGTGSVYFSVSESYTMMSVDDGVTFTDYADTQECLRLTNANIILASMPNVILTSQTPMRSGLGGTTFSTPFDVYRDTFSAAKSINLSTGLYSYMKSSTVDLTLYNTSTTGVKSTETGVLPSGYSLQNVGDTYGIQVTYENAVGTSTSGTMTAVFEYYVEYDKDSTTNFSDSVIRTASISV